MTNRPLRDPVSASATSNSPMLSGWWKASVKSKQMGCASKSPRQKCDAPLKLRKNSRTMPVRDNLWALLIDAVHVCIIYDLLAGQIYLKTTVLEHDILSGSWRSEPFSPSLSTRWDSINSTVVIPLVNEDGVEHISVKTTVATKTKLGKKIVLGTIYIRPDLDASHEQWTTMITSRNIPVPMWYSFE